MTTPRRSRGKLLAISVAAIGLALIAAAAVALRGRISEEYFLWKLEKGDPDEQVAAAEWLGNKRSVRAVPGIVGLFRKEVASHVASKRGSDFIITFGNPDSHIGERARRLKKALVAVGKPAVASRSLASNPPSLAVDGLKDTLWIAGDFAPQSLDIDLQGAFTVSRIRLLVAQTPNGPTTHRVYVRDAGSAGEDLVHLVQEESGGPAETPASRGALLFSCNGRGTRMFGRPDHDVGCLRAGFAGPVPTAGFFAMREIGPVGRRNFVHGFTASVALFRERPG